MPEPDGHEPNASIGWGPQMIDPLYAISGFGVGFLVGMTGIGGGALMTPLLILLFGIHPTTAVGTDLLYAAATKTGGGLVHGFARSIDWPIVKRLALGSIPATIITLYTLSYINSNGAAASSLITIVLCCSLMATAGVLIFRNNILATYRIHFTELDPRRKTIVTVIVGVFLGVLVSISSVGAGAIGVMALVILYPRLPVATIVGSDIAHAVPLTLIAGIGHWMIGTVDWHIIEPLLVGSLPGIFLGSYLAVRIPETALRMLLATTLLVVASKLAFDYLDQSSLVTALTKWAAIN
jgi:uncharacterized membrane protein YfcA